MSMLTEQCDRLRKTAYEVERIKNNNADCLLRDSIKLAEAAQEMRSAADTIADLRLLCQELQEQEWKTCRLEETEHEHEVPIDLPGYAGGTYIEVTYDCDECGYENRDCNVRYCGGCGRKIVR